jgi:hypothetical protein
MKLSDTWFNNAWIREQLNLPKQRTKVSGDLHLEIAALKAERDRLTIIADAIQAERDDLLSANKLLHGTIDSYERDHAALRAALEQIAHMPYPQNYEAKTIARRALEGK